MTKKHCDRPKFAVIGYGKLGGKELGYDSDLDLVFIYDDPDLEADLTYSRLVRRMMSWLTIQTSSGKLFDVDLRLRPNGDSGLIVSSFDMFIRGTPTATAPGSGSIRLSRAPASWRAMRTWASASRTRGARS